MDDDARVRKLVEIIFSGKFKNIAEVTPDSSIPTCLITDDFPQRLQGVLIMKHAIFNNEWREYIGSCSKIILSSVNSWLNCVIFACLFECHCYQSVFESFISVCVLLKFFSNEMLTKTGIDFRDLNTDVFIILYEKVMKSFFCEQGGFARLVEYIHGHRYLSCEWNWKDPDSTDDSTGVMITEDIKKEVRKEENRHPGTHAHLREMNVISVSLAKMVLSTTLVELPTLPNNPDLITYLETSKSEEMAEKTEKERNKEASGCDSCVFSQGSSSNSDSKTGHTINQSWDEAEYESIILAVIKYHHSRGSDHTNSDNHILKEADGILEHMTDTIKSLKIVVDDYTKE